MQRKAFYVDQIGSYLPALELLPLYQSHRRRDQPRGSNSNAGEMDQTWYSPKAQPGKFHRVNKWLLFLTKRPITNNNCMNKAVE